MRDRARLEVDQLPKDDGHDDEGTALSRMLLYEFGRRLDIARKRFAAFIREAE